MKSSVAKNFDYGRYQRRRARHQLMSDYFPRGDKNKTAFPLDITLCNALQALSRLRNERDISTH